MAGLGSPRTGQLVSAPHGRSHFEEWHRVFSAQTGTMRNMKELRAGSYEYRRVVVNQVLSGGEHTCTYPVFLRCLTSSTDGRLNT